MLSVITGERPGEHSIELSDTVVLRGPVTFEVKNHGRLTHGFEICTRPLAAGVALPDSCLGRQTPLLAPGASATLTVRFSRTGRYEYLSPAPGDVSYCATGSFCGMRGTIRVVIEIPKKSFTHNCICGPGQTPLNQPPPTPDA